jgi:dTDP-4-amino-4,6-dideoxygalactose transaminase
MDAIMALARERKLIVVEDCAQAPGARYKGRRVGSIGDFGCFSFHTHKNISTLGEGGMLTVRDPAHAVAARRFRWMGNWPFAGDRQRYWKPAMSNLVEPLPGHWPFNFCMGEPNAAVGRLLLKRLDAINEQRRRQARRLMTALADCPELVFQAVPEGCEHVYHLLAARFDGGGNDDSSKARDDLIELLFTKYQLKLIVQYWPLYRSELFRNFGLGQARVPEADRFFDHMVSFPWWSDMSDDVLDEMAARVHAALAELRG